MTKTTALVVFMSIDEQADDAPAAGEYFILTVMAAIGMMVMVEDTDMATVIAEPVPQAEIAGPLTLCPGETGVIYTVTETTPAGNPAFSIKRANSSIGAGAISDAFKTTVQPAARAGPSFVAVRNI